MMSPRKLLQHIQLILLATTCCMLFPRMTVAAIWPDIRDGVIHIRVPDNHPSPVTIVLGWKDAWISKSQEDHIFLQNPEGSLLQRIELVTENTPGKSEIQLGAPGDYRLEVTGASFRNITVEIPAKIPSMFEPVKVHKSVSLPGSGQLFFQIPKETTFTFGCKNYEKVRGFTLVPAGGASVELGCKKYRHYAEFDSKALQANNRDAIWQLTWKGRGKVSFWLDKVPNLFAQSPDELFVPRQEKTSSSAIIGSQVLGRVPAIGAALPFTAPPPTAYDILSSWRLLSANHYIFTDYYGQKETHGTDFLSLYEKQFAIPFNNAIFSMSGRNAVFDSVQKAEAAILDYLGHHDTPEDHITSFAIGDEPNLNYPSYERYSIFFGTIATAIKNHPNGKIRNARLAVPQSSGFLDGPTRNGAENRRGIDWAEKLINEYGEYIGAISWHQWLVRDLIDTGRYRQAVQRATDLVEKYRHRFQGSPALIIGQTNIASGNSLSPYENDTFFAALWWTSVVIESSLPGKLQQLVWFKAADDGVYNKGLVTMEKNGFVEKPVSRAMSFINSHLGTWVVDISSNHPELDLLATLSSDKRELRLLGVNKAQRNHLLTLELPGDYSTMYLDVFDEAGKTSQTEEVKGRIHELPISGETIFAARFRTK